LYKTGGRVGVASPMVHCKPTCAERYIFPTLQYRWKSFDGGVNLCTLTVFH